MTGTRAAFGQALYRGMDRASLDAAYNNRAAVAAFGMLAERRRKLSEQVRRARSFHSDLRYGDLPRQRMDFFPAAAPGAPVFVFVHGGYWQSTEKEQSSYLVEGPLERGFCVALVEYTLAPEAAIDDMVEEIGLALDWLYVHAEGLGGDRTRLYVGGHSAGAHLAVMMLEHACVAGVLAISGLFDLEPIRLCYLNEKLRLSEASARRNSPVLRIPPKAPPLAVSVGTGELPELVRQSAQYAEAARQAGLGARYLPLEGHDHFTILDELAQPHGALCEALCQIGREA